MTDKSTLKIIPLETLACLRQRFFHALKTLNTDRAADATSDRTTAAQRRRRRAQKLAPAKDSAQRPEAGAAENEPTTAATSLHRWERRPAADAQRPTRRRQAAEHDHGRTTRARRAEERPKNRTTARHERGDGARRRRSERTEKHAERRQNAGEARPAPVSGGRRTLGAGRGKPTTRRSPERRTAESVHKRRYPLSSLLR